MKLVIFQCYYKGILLLRIPEKNTISITHGLSTVITGPHRRLCYFQDEFIFSNFKNKGHRYSLSNCLQEAMETTAYEKCGCDFFNRRERKGRRDIYCTGANLTCFQRVRRQWGTHRKAKDHSGHVKVRVKNRAETLGWLFVVCKLDRDDHPLYCLISIVVH